MGFDEIRSLLPHAFPMLMLDRVLELEPGKRIVTRKCISGSELYLQGHFPKGSAIVPGVLLVEAIAQSALLLGLKSNLTSLTHKIHYLTSIKATFRGVAVPGDVIDFEIFMDVTTEKAVSYTGIGRVNEKVIVKATNLSVLALTEEQ